jgi:hypothetical protein
VELVLFALLIRSRSAYAAGSAFLLQEWVVAGTGTGKFTVFFTNILMAIPAKASAKSTMLMRMS